MINVLMYNTHLFDGIGGGLTASLQGILDTPLLFEDKARLQAIISHINSDATKADVIGLTEVWSDTSKNTVIDQVKSKYPFSFFNKTSVFEMGSGLLLLSRTPFSEPAFEKFDSLHGFDDISQKGILSAVVRPTATQKKTLIILAHTQSGEASDDKGARADNIQQLSRRVSRLNSGDIDSIILMGDLNVIAEDGSGAPTQEYRQTLLPALKSAGLAECYRKLHASAAANPGFTYDGAKNPLIKTFAASEAAFRQRLDYIFTTATPVAMEVESAFTYSSAALGADCPTSDHFPVSGRIDVSDNISGGKNGEATGVFGKTDLKQLAKADGKTDRNDLLVGIENGTGTTFNVNFRVEHGSYDKSHGSSVLPSPDFKRQNPEASHYEIGFEAIGAGCDVAILLEHEGIIRKFRFVTPPNQPNYFMFDNGKDGFGQSGKNMANNGFQKFSDDIFLYEASMTGTSAAIGNIRIIKAD